MCQNGHALRQFSKPKGPLQGQIGNKNLRTHNVPQNLPKLIFTQKLWIMLPFWKNVRIKPNSCAGRGDLNWTRSNECRQSCNYCATIVQLGPRIVDLEQVKWEQAIVQLSCKYRAAIVQLSCKLSFRDAWRLPGFLWGTIWESFSFAIFWCFLWFLQPSSRTTRSSENKPGRREALWKITCQAIVRFKKFCALQWGSKTCHSTKIFPGINFPQICHLNFN